MPHLRPTSLPSLRPILNQLSPSRGSRGSCGSITRHFCGGERRQYASLFRSRTVTNLVSERLIIRDVRAANRFGDLGSGTSCQSQISLYHASRIKSLDDRRSSPNSSEASSSAEKQNSNNAPPLANTPLANTIETARERTKAVGETVRESLVKLTPYENIYNIPNLLTVSRLFAAPATAYLLLHDQHKWAVALFAYAGITDLIDGWMARRFKLQTVAGSVIDPMADKALMIILTVTLAIKGALPLYLATLILGRDATLALAAIYYRYASLPAPKTFLRYWDFSLPSAEVHPTTVSKYNTFLQLILIGSTLALPLVTASGEFSGILHSTLGVSDALLLKGMIGFQILVAATTAWSGLSYSVLKNAVAILGKDEALKAKQGARGRAIIGVSFGGVVLLAAWLAWIQANEEEEEIREEVDNAD